MAKNLRRHIAGTWVAAAAMLMSPAASARAEGQSKPARPPIDFNEAAERARELGRSEPSFGKYLSSEQFQLFNNCEPVTVGTAYVSLDRNPSGVPDMAAIGEHRRRIRFLMETRFRNARLLDAEERARARFSISMRGSPDDFVARASFEKVVIDLATGESAFVETYTLTALGGPGRIDPTPYAKASSMIDRFLTDYLAANADACAEPGKC